MKSSNILNNKALGSFCDNNLTKLTTVTRVVDRYGVCNFARIWFNPDFHFNWTNFIPNYSELTRNSWISEVFFHNYNCRIWPIGIIMACNPKEP